MISIFKTQLLAVMTFAIMFTYAYAENVQVKHFVLSEAHVTNFISAQDDLQKQMASIQQAIKDKENDNFEEALQTSNKVNQELKNSEYVDEQGNPGVAMSLITLAKHFDNALYEETATIARQHGFSSLEEWANVSHAISSASNIASMKAMKFYRSPQLDTHTIPAENIALVEKYDPLDILD